MSQLITIGGDDTAFSAMKVEQRADRRIRVVHVPKTIDNGVAIIAEGLVLDLDPGDLAQLVCMRVDTPKVGIPCFSA